MPEVIDDQVTGFICDSINEMVTTLGATESIRPADCRSHVERRFSAQTLVTGYEHVYQRAISDPRAPLADQSTCPTEGWSRRPRPRPSARETMNTNPVGSRRCGP